MNEKTGHAGFVFIDCREFLGVICAHWKRFGAINDGVVVSDNIDRQIKESDHGKDISMFDSDVDGKF